MAEQAHIPDVRVKRDVTIYFKDKTKLAIKADELLDFQIMDQGFLFVIYKPTITADEKEHMDIHYYKRWYRLDEVERVEESRIERRLGKRDIFEFKRDSKAFMRDARLALDGKPEDAPTPQAYE